MNPINRLLIVVSDPRYYQIIVLSLLLGYGIIELDFGIRWQNALVIVATALAVQFLGTRYAGLPRYQGKHIFNPANFALVSLILLSDHAWVSSGQWGSAAIGAFVLASVAYSIQFIYYQPNGPILALIICAPLVPVIDSLLRGRIYRWEKPAGNTASTIKGVC